MKLILEDGRVKLMLEDGRVKLMTLKGGRVMLEGGRVKLKDERVKLMKGGRVVASGTHWTHSAVL